MVVLTRSLLPESQAAMLTLLRAPAVRIYLNFDRQCLSDPTLAIGYSTTFDDLTSSNCTTCMVNDDKSAYWIPELVCSSRLLHVKDIVKPLPNLVLSVPERIIRGSRPRRNDSVGLQNGSADEVSLIVLQVLSPAQRFERDRATFPRWASYAHRRPICPKLHRLRRIAGHLLALVSFFFSSRANIKAHAKTN